MKNIKSFCAFVIINFVFIANLSAQVPVREEPRHKVVLENDYVRLLDVHIAAHDTTLTHIHAAPSVIVFLSKTTIGTQIVGDKPNISDVNPGQTSYAAYDEKPIKHRVWNQSNSLFHVMDIELVKKDISNDTCKLISDRDAKLQWQQKLVRAYKIDIAAGKQIHIEESNCAHLLINVSGILTATSAGHMHTMQTGGYVFFKPQSNIEISGSKENAQAVLLELK